MNFWFSVVYTIYPVHIFVMVCASNSKWQNGFFFNVLTFGKTYTRPGSFSVNAILQFKLQMRQVEWKFKFHMCGTGTTQSYIV